MVAPASKRLTAPVPLTTARTLLDLANDAYLAGKPTLAAVRLREAIRRYLIAHCQSEGVTLPPDERCRPINTSAVARLKILMEHSEPTPFGIVNRSAWYTHWHALRIVAGLPEWARPHTIRKSHASHLAAAGGDATESRGHATRRMTQENYLDPTIADNRRNLELLPDPDTNAPKPGLLGRLFGKR